jgi:hypothetical protein
MAINRFHWGFLVGPKVEDKPQVPGMRYHVKNHPTQGWMYEEIDLDDVQSTARLLARIVVARLKTKSGSLKSSARRPSFKTIPIGVAVPGSPMSYHG